MKIKIVVPEWNKEKEVREYVPREGVRVALFTEVSNMLTDENGWVVIDDNVLPCEGIPVIYRARSLGILPSENVWDEHKDRVIVAQPDDWCRQPPHEEEENLFAMEWVREVWISSLKSWWSMLFPKSRRTK